MQVDQSLAALGRLVIGAARVMRKVRRAGVDRLAPRDVFGGAQTDQLTVAAYTQTQLVGRIKLFARAHGVAGRFRGEIVPAAFARVVGARARAATWPSRVVAAR